MQASKSWVPFDASTPLLKGGWMMTSPVPNFSTARLFSRLMWQIVRKDPLTVRPELSFFDHWAMAVGLGGCLKLIFPPPSRRASSTLAIVLHRLFVVVAGGLVEFVVG